MASFADLPAELQLLTTIGTRSRPAQDLLSFSSSKHINNDLCSPANNDEPTHQNDDDDGGSLELRETPNAGYGVFAKQSISQGQLVFSTAAASFTRGPFVNVVYKPFRREVCAHCFFYDRGKKMKVVHLASESPCPTSSTADTLGQKRQTRNHLNQQSEIGLAWFCSGQCKELWQERLGVEGLCAWTSVCTALARHKRAKSVGDALDARRSSASPEDIEREWQSAILKPISGIRLIDEGEDDEDTLMFLLDGIIARYSRPDEWQAFTSLVPSLQPYTDKGGLATLRSHVRIYHFLREQILAAKSEIAEQCTPETILSLICRDHGNSFGIFEDDLGREGEMLGYGSWTQASFFNHSCRPNLQKERKGRNFIFSSIRDVDVGEELSISYIGDPSGLDTNERRERLQRGWGFHCMCSRCTTDSSSS